MTVVTLSATYGAGGSVIGPRVAEALGVPFVDRAIPAEVARRMAIPLEEALARDGRAEHGLGAILASLARMPVLTGAPPPTAVGDERLFCDRVETVIREVMTHGGVLLGRAGALVLADHPQALHVRLDGPVEARIAQAERLGATDARAAQRDADRARDAYVRHFYREDACKASLYHLVIDSTRIDLDTCVEIIAAAARSTSSPG